MHMPRLLRHKDRGIADRGENRRVAEIKDNARTCCIGEICPQALSITGAEVFVAGDETQHAAGAEQLQGPFKEIDVEVRRAGICLVLALERIL